MIDHVSLERVPASIFSTTLDGSAQVHREHGSVGAHFEVAGTNAASVNSSRVLEIPRGASSAAVSSPRAFPAPSRSSGIGWPNAVPSSSDQDDLLPEDRGKVRKFGMGMSQHPHLLRVEMMQSHLSSHFPLPYALSR